VAVIVTAAVLLGFFLGYHPPLVAAAGGALLLIRRTRDPRDIYGDVDWSLLVLFLGLFLIVGAPSRQESPRLSCRPQRASTCTTV